MKKLNKKGFTLIELLAVITIMGILLLVAIPAITRTIENSRRDTFADNVKTYINTVRNAVLADELKCTGYDTVSGTPDGTYYYKIDTTQTGTKDLMESVAKSSWGGADVQGYVKWVKDEGKTKYSAFITDKNKHGMFKENEETAVTRSAIAANVEKEDCTGKKDDNTCPLPETPSDTGAIECELK